MPYQFYITENDNTNEQHNKEIVQALIQAEALKRKNITNTKDNEGHYLGDRVTFSAVKYLKKHGINPDFGFSFTRTDLITDLISTVKCVETSVPVSSRPGEYLNSHELNIINIRRALARIFTASRVTLIWSWDGITEAEQGKPVRAREILIHPSARVKVVVSPIKGLNDGCNASGEIVSGVVINDDGDAIDDIA